MTLRPPRAPDPGARCIHRPGPTTVRAHEDLAPLLDRMQRRGTSAALVTDADGHLLGVLVRDARRPGPDSSLLSNKDESWPA